MPLNTTANKAVYTGLAGALSIVLIWLLGLFHITVPGEVASAITTILGAGAAYVIPNAEG